MTTKRIEVTDRQRRYIRENWGVMTMTDMADALAMSRTMVNKVARTMELPYLMKSGASAHWNAGDLWVLNDAIARNMGPAEIRRKFFPLRSYDAIKRKVWLLTGNKKRVRSVPKPPPPKPAEIVVQNFAPKVMALEPLQYTIEDCPRVTLDDACRWMRQAKREWVRPADDRQAWLEINAERLYGAIPVPPFLPDRRPVHNDDARIVRRELPEWRVGAT